MTKLIFDEDMKKLYGYTYNDVWNYFISLSAKFAGNGDDERFQYNVSLVYHNMAMIEGAFKLADALIKSYEDGSELSSSLYMMDDLAIMLKKAIYKKLDDMVTKFYPQFKETIKND